MHLSHCSVRLLTVQRLGSARFGAAPGILSQRLTSKSTPIRVIPSAARNLLFVPVYCKLRWTTADPSTSLGLPAGYFARDDQLGMRNRKRFRNQTNKDSRR